MTARRSILTILSIFVFAGVVSPPASAQSSGTTLDWNRVDDPMFEALGVQLGLKSGTGLSYKYPLTWWLYLQGTGGIWHSGDHKRHNLGAELQYVLRAEGRDKLFLTAGAGWYYHKEGEVEKDHVSGGLGVGMERLMGERWAIQGELDFLVRGNKDTVIILPQVGAYFYF